MRKKIPDDKKKKKITVSVDIELTKIMENYLNKINIKRSNYIENLIRKDMIKRGKNMEREF